ncbi:MAG: hypothetical protein IKL84_09245 [Clostridia bacterium]|nr:hypothetical protein [Clostridia bacterium]
MEGEIDDFSFSAELELFPLGTDAEGREMSPDTRDFTLTYTAPASLAGLKLIRRGEQIRLRCGAVNVETDDSRFAGMLLPAMLFCIDCEMGEAAVVEHNGATLNRISVTDDEGRYLLWLDADGFPCRIEAIVDARSITVDVLRCPDESGS